MIYVSSETVKLTIIGKNLRTTAKCIIVLSKWLSGQIGGSMTFCINLFSRFFTLNIPWYFLDFAYIKWWNYSRKSYRFFFLLYSFKNESKHNRSTEGCSTLNRSVDMISSGKNGLNIRTNASPKWDRIGVWRSKRHRWLAAPVAMFYGNLQNLVIRSKSVIKSSLRNMFANWCNVWSIESVIVYGHDCPRISCNIWERETS